ncbi:hypothetical protein [Providencia sp. PROV174]|uniref:hypothetical protein n=1 Tax=Providencia sp. PROV174 TaxID=2949877 RepID=UPI00234953BF|nr:hypothetical protein [Providencia sp. PROV174]
MILECLALEAACLNEAWDWVYENWNWGIVIAIISLRFTAKALKKTDRANLLSENSLRITKSSLELTEEATNIAKESLNAAKKSIETSIEIYNKQKNDNDRQKKADRNNNVMGILDVAGKEAFLVLQYLLFIIELQDLANKAVSIDSKLSQEAEWNSVYFKLPNGGVVKTGQIPYVPKYFSHEVLINSAVSSPELFSMLLNLNGQILVVEKNMIFLMRQIKNSEIDELKDYLNYYIPRDGENLFIQSMLNDVLRFEQQMKDYSGFVEVKRKIILSLF